MIIDDPTSEAWALSRMTRFVLTGSRSFAETFDGAQAEARCYKYYDEDESQWVKYTG